MANLTGNKRKASDSHAGKSKVKDRKNSFKKDDSNIRQSKNKKGKTGDSKPNPVEANVSSSAQRRALKKERQSHRRHADIVTDAKEIWNQIRQKSNTKDDIVRLMGELMTLLYHSESTLCEIALQHDASRVIQAAIQFADDSQRRKICHSLQPKIAELSKIPYSHFCVLKLIQYAHRDPECLKMIVKVRLHHHYICIPLHFEKVSKTYLNFCFAQLPCESKALKGNIVSLAVHAVGSRVVEHLFETIPSKHTCSLRQEFYGPHFSKFSDELILMEPSKIKATPSLQNNLELHPEKKESTCSFMINNIIQKGMDKALFGYAYFQQLLSEYIGVVGYDKDLISNLVDHTLPLLSTRAGTQVVLYCTAYGNNKDRKKILKALKGYTRSSLLHRDAYLAIMQIILVLDDTVSVYKSILSELLTKDPNKGDDENHPLLEIALHDQASKLFFCMFCSTPEDRAKLLDPLEESLLITDPKVMEQGVEITTSKKNPETRRKELAQYLMKPLEQMCLQHLEQIARSLPGSRLLQLLCQDDNFASVKKSLVMLCTESDAENENFILNDAVAHYIFKHMIIKNKEFAESFAEGVDIEKCLSSSRAAFVLAALCKALPQHKSLQRITRKKVQASIKRLKQSNDAAITAGLDALLESLPKA
jgi:pumilio homology domain family member 6